jgi:predicted  nucleic acid-binding Zn-ribbon protein
MISAGSGELLTGCKECKGHFFFYIKDDKANEVREQIIDMTVKQKKVMEEEIRESVGIIDDKSPVILDVESIRVTGEGKFELDLDKLFKKDRPLIYKLEEGKYIIDLASTLKMNAKDLKQIRNPDEL